MLTKKFLNGSDRCSVAFSLSGTVQGKTVYLVGDFNNWDETAMPMQCEADGSFSLTIEVEKNREYQFRYLVNGIEWHNDWNADRYVPNPYSGDNSVVNLYESDHQNET